MKYYYLVSKPILGNKMLLYIVFFVYFKLLKLVFHVVNIVLTQSDSFQCVTNIR